MCAGPTEDSGDRMGAESLFGEQDGDRVLWNYLEERADLVNTCLKQFEQDSLRESSDATVDCGEGEGKGEREREKQKVSSLSVGLA